ncbi:MAG TPA: (Fe-S)-binding protein [Pyrinomonadaceae bacterium]|jgi:L-lactate dehydrogenase complex protein LldE
MKVALFVTCLVDQMWTSIGMSSVEVLRRVGCEVEFDKRQTCCAQPAFNTGYLDEARLVARRFIRIFEQSKADAIVSPSGPCTPMVHHYAQLFACDSEWLPRAQSIAAKTHELSSFLVRVLKKEDVGATWNGRLTWHDACHGLRDLNLESRSFHDLWTND